MFFVVVCVGIFFLPVTIVQRLQSNFFEPWQIAAIRLYLRRTLILQLYCNKKISNIYFASFKAPLGVWSFLEISLYSNCRKS
jgi:hypothetical protein